MIGAVGSSGGLAPQRRAIIGLGASLGDRRTTLSLAVQCLAAWPGVRCLDVSRVYESVPLGAARSLFLNAAVLVSTRRSPRALLEMCKSIERRLGRRPAARWADRVIDLDLLLVEGCVRRGQHLRLPHPGLLLRDFALIPAQEVAPSLRHGVACLCLRDAPPPSVRTGCRPVGSIALRVARETARSWSDQRQRNMKLFLDSPSLDQLRQASAWGVVDGVWSHACMLAGDGPDSPHAIRRTCQIVAGPVLAQTLSTEWQGLVAEGRLLARTNEHLVVCVPSTVDGLRATAVLVDDGIDVHVGLCFGPDEALSAAQAGAAYVSVFLGDYLDRIRPADLDRVKGIAALYADNPDLGTRILVDASRHAKHLPELAQAGVDIAVLPFFSLKSWCVPTEMVLTATEVGTVAERGALP
ncbi:MAG: 2-amino-4-hydroxy-6-hydroxymethyldihydropteridine diphosphokinase [Oligoflexia bacterium]|nr:2-amino-4-hydroxy-6-hydroxymethyldihydropteridine diphosphokinase [Oligoflexia bacterium]